MEAKTQVHDHLTILPFFVMLKVQMRDLLTKYFIWVEDILTDNTAHMQLDVFSFHYWIVGPKDSQVIRVGCYVVYDGPLYGMELPCSDYNHPIGFYRTLHDL